MPAQPLRGLHCTREQAFCTGLLLWPVTSGKCYVPACYLSKRTQLTVSCGCHQAFLTPRGWIVVTPGGGDQQSRPWALLLDISGGPSRMEVLVCRVCRYVPLSVVPSPLPVLVPSPHQPCSGLWIRTSQQLWVLSDLMAFGSRGKDVYLPDHG